MTDESVRLVCGECDRSGDVRPGVLDLGSHHVAFEETENGLVIQWQNWSGHWFCHTCLAEYAGGDDADEYYPESVAERDGGRE